MSKAKHPCPHCGKLIARPWPYTRERVCAYSGEFGGDPIWYTEEVVDWQVIAGDDFICPKCEQRVFLDLRAAETPGEKG